MAITDEILKVAGTIGVAIVGVAIVAVIVGKNAQTSGVIQSAGGALSSVIGAAVAPVSSGTGTTGSSTSADISTPLGSLENPTNPGGNSGLYTGGANFGGNGLMIPGTSNPVPSYSGYTTDFGSAFSPSSALDFSSNDPWADIGA